MPFRDDNNCNPQTSETLCLVGYGVTSAQILSRPHIPAFNAAVPKLFACGFRLRLVRKPA